MMAASAAPETWPEEINRHGPNRRFVVTNMTGHPQGIYHGIYVQRVPERPIGELKNAN